MTVYEAFCGIGGFSLGFQRAGFKIIGGCEIDPYARAVYKKNFGIEPDGDIRKLISFRGADIVCGGFPCQPFSVAGLQRGTEDERNLWPDFFDTIRRIRPRWIVMENVPALLSVERGRIFRGMLLSLSACGYDIEWDCLTASQFGAPHRRSRIWIIAHSNNKRRGKKQISKQRKSNQAEPWNDGETKLVADTKSVGSTTSRTSGGQPEQPRNKLDGDWRASWETEPRVGRVADGVSHRMDRLRCLGNAIVPQIAQWIAERIKEVEVKP